MLASDALQRKYRQKNHAGRTSLVKLDVFNGVSMRSRLDDALQTWLSNYIDSFLTSASSRNTCSS